MATANDIANLSSAFIAWVDSFNELLKNNADAASSHAALLATESLATSFEPFVSSLATGNPVFTRVATVFGLPLALNNLSADVAALQTALQKPPSDEQQHEVISAAFGMVADAAGAGASVAAIASAAMLGSNVLLDGVAATAATISGVASAFKFAYDSPYLGTDVDTAFAYIKNNLLPAGFLGDFDDNNSGQDLTPAASSIQSLLTAADQDASNGETVTLASNNMTLTATITNPTTGAATTLTANSVTPDLVSVTDLGAPPGIVVPIDIVFDPPATPTGINSSDEVVGSALFANPSPLHGFSWVNGTFTDLGALTTNQSSNATAINNSGMIVGYATYTGPDAGPTGEHAVVWNDGIPSDLGTFEPDNAGDSEAFAINSSGVIAGYASAVVPDTDNLLGVDENAAIWQDGVITDLGTLGNGNVPAQTYYSVATGMNDSEDVVGYSTTNIANPGSGELVTHAFLWNGAMEDLGTLAASGGTSQANAINNSDQVVGYSYPTTSIGPLAQPMDAVLWQDGTIVNLSTWTQSDWIDNAGDVETTPSVASDAEAINNAGQIVGQATYEGGQERAILWQNNTMTDLNTLLPADSGWTLIDATAINDNGMVAGTGYHNGLEAAYELQLPAPATPAPPTPTPTPAPVVNTVTTSGPIGDTSGDDWNVAADAINVAVVPDNTSPIFIQANNDNIDLGQPAASYSLTDDGQGSQFLLPFSNPNGVTISINDFQNDTTGVFNLVDQFASPQAAAAALTSDGNGGSLLALNGGALKLDFVGDTTLTAADFKTSNL